VLGRVRWCLFLFPVPRGGGRRVRERRRGGAARLPSLAGTRVPSFAGPLDETSAAEQSGNGTHAHVRPVPTPGCHNSQPPRNPRAKPPQHRQAEGRTDAAAEGNAPRADGRWIVAGAAALPLCPPAVAPALPVARSCLPWLVWRRAFLQGMPTAGTDNGPVGREKMSAACSFCERMGDEGRRPHKERGGGAENRCCFSSVDVVYVLTCLSLLSSVCPTRPFD